jgi:hypothetical protein
MHQSGLHLAYGHSINWLPLQPGATDRQRATLLNVLAILLQRVGHASKSNACSISTVLAPHIGHAT